MNEGIRSNDKPVEKGLSHRKKLIANTLNAMWKIHKLQPNDVLAYVSDKLEKVKWTVSWNEYIMAEKTAERWSDRISSVSFLDSQFVQNNDFLASKIDDYAKETDQQVELFKKFLILEIIKSIKKIKNNTSINYKQNFVNLRCDYELPSLVIQAAKKSNINPNSIFAEKSGVVIWVGEWERAEYTDWYQQPRKTFDLTWKKE